MYDFDTLVDRRCTDAVKWRTVQACRSGAYADVIPMWVADMDFASPPEVRAALAERVAHPVYGYSGEPEALYAAYIGWMRSRHSASVKREWLTFSPGIVPAIATAIRAYSAKGDGVVITPPVYHPFKRLIEKNGRSVVEAPLVRKDGRYALDLEALDAACARARLLVFCSPHNPVGRAWTSEELAAVAEITRRRNVVALVDEIHGDLVYAPGAMRPSFSVEAFGPGLVAAWAPSKTFNIAGLQASVIAIPDEGLRAAFKGESETTGLDNPNCMAVGAAVAAYERCGPWLDEALAYMKGNYETLVAGLADAAPGIRVYPLEGTYLAWLDLSGVGLSGDVHGELVDRAGLWLDAGTRFGTGGGGFARINLGCPRSLVEEAARRLGSAFGRRA